MTNGIQVYLRNANPYFLSSVVHFVEFADNKFFSAVANLHRGIRGKPEFWTLSPDGHVIVTPRPRRTEWKVIVEKEHALSWKTESCEVSTKQDSSCRVSTKQDVTISPYGFPLHLH